MVCTMSAPSAAAATARRETGPDPRARRAPCAARSRHSRETCAGSRLAASLGSVLAVKAIRAVLTGDGDEEYSGHVRCRGEDVGNGCCDQCQQRRAGEDGEPGPVVAVPAGRAISGAATVAARTAPKPSRTVPGAGQVHARLATRAAAQHEAARGPVASRNRAVRRPSASAHVPCTRPAGSSRRRACRSFRWAGQTWRRRARAACQ